MGDREVRLVRDRDVVVEHPIAHTLRKRNNENGTHLATMGPRTLFS